MRKKTKVKTANTQLVAALKKGQPKKTPSLAWPGAYELARQENDNEAQELRRILRKNPGYMAGKVEVDANDPPNILKGYEWARAFHAVYPGKRYPMTVRAMRDEQEAYAYAFIAQYGGKHLTNDEKRGMIEQALIRCPSFQPMSYRQLSALLGPSDHLIKEVVEELVPLGKIKRPAKTTGKDGRQRKGIRPPTAKKAQLATVIPHPAKIESTGPQPAVITSQPPPEKSVKDDKPVYTVEKEEGNQVVIQEWHYADYAPMGDEVSVTDGKRVVYRQPKAIYKSQTEAERQYQVMLKALIRQHEATVAAYKAQLTKKPVVRYLRRQRKAG